MPHPVLDRMCDRLTVNPPYEGVVAQGYDAWIPVDEPLAEEVVLLQVLEEAEGTALELGCGTGRPLLRWLAQGHEVEGIDASADMLAILHRHARDRGLDPVTHHGDIAPLHLDRTYGAIVCPAGTFSLIADPERAAEALRSYRDHLDPGGRLALTAFVPVEDLGEAMTWRVRRTGTTPEGTTIVVHEATSCDEEQQLQVVFNRVETYDSDGRLQDTWLRRIHLRWWTQEQLAGLLQACGFTDVRAIGGGDAWVTMARATS